MIWRPDRKKTYTPSARVVNTGKPVSERFVTNPPANRRPPGGMRIPRLSFGALTAKEAGSVPELWRMINDGPLNSKFLFPDTGFITTTIQPEFWTVARGRYLTFSEQTIAELSGWFAKPLFNSYLHPWLPRAAKESLILDSSIEVLFRQRNVFGLINKELVPISVAIANKDSYKSCGFDFYVKMLSVRKLRGVVAFRELKERLGHEPTDSELRNYLQNQDPILAPIAFKGSKDVGKRNYLADEELVVTAVLTAILSGEETLILTRDTDVFEQFTKLVYWLTADYAAFRYATVHYLNPEGCPLFPLEIPEDKRGDPGFAGSEIYNIVLPDSEMDRLWPETYTPVHAYCVLLGNTHLDPRISIAAYCLEKEMSWMLGEKGRTGGKNTERFPGRNMRIGTSPDRESRGTLFTLCEEKFVTYEGVEIAWFDLHEALRSEATYGIKHTVDNLDVNWRFAV